LVYFQDYKFVLLISSRSSISQAFKTSFAPSTVSFHFYTREFTAALNLISRLGGLSVFDLSFARSEKIAERIIHFYECVT